MTIVIITITITVDDTISVDYGFKDITIFLKNYFFVRFEKITD
ncbi:hypothetical protein K3495_g8943 [Podosphaera aphanis]|nr:hypothetical protein K3495_g8943 [Podosphaera aphanis]